MKKIIRQILKEDREQMFLDKVIKYTKNDFPLIKNLKDYGFYEQLSRDELNYILSGIFGKPVEYYEGGNNIYDENNKRIYSENSDGYWIKKEYDNNGNVIYYENSNGYWEKYEYEFDNNGNIIYYEDSNGYWKKWEYDENGNNIYYENSDGVIYTIDEKYN
jgi:hypothetical protein